MPEKALTFPDIAMLLLLMAEAEEISNPELEARYRVTLNGRERRKLNDLKLVESWKQGRSYVHVLTDQGWARVAEEVRAGIEMPPKGGGKLAAAAALALAAGLQRFLDRTDQRYSDIFTPRNDAEPASAEHGDDLTPTGNHGSAPVSPNGMSSAAHDASTTTSGGLASSDRQATPPSSTPKEVSSAVSPITTASGSETDLVARIRAAYADLAREPGAWVSLTKLRPLLGDAPRADVDEALRQMNRMPDVNIVPESNQKALTPQDRDAAVNIGDQDKHLLWIGAR